MRVSTSRIWVGFAGLLWVFLARSAFAEPDDLERDLHRVLAVFLAENPSAPGAAAFLDCPALGLAWSDAVGTAARGVDEPMTPRHCFRIASNTKTYTAAAVLRLVEMGRLNLDASLASSLPAADLDLLRQDGYAVEDMTLRQLLRHTSSLAEHPGDQRYADAIMADPRHRWTPKEQLGLCVAWFDPVGRPGARFWYSDTGYVLLGNLIETKTHENLGAAVRELLGFDRLGLTHTWWEVFEEAPKDAGPRAHQYFGDVDTTEFDASFDLYGGGGIVTDTIELGRFMQLLLQGKVLTEPKTLDSMTESGTSSYRLGLMAMDLDGVPALGHQGFWNTFAFYLPSLKVTVSGCILNHHAENGRILADRLVAVVHSRIATKPPGPSAP